MIGSGSDNQIDLPLDQIERTQASIEFDAERDCYYLENLGSRFRTRLDGVQFEGKVPLDDLHVITLAERIDFIFRWADRPSSGQAPASGTMVRQPGRIETPPALPPALATGPDSSPAQGRTLYAKLKRLVVPTFREGDSARSSPKVSETVFEKAPDLRLPAALRNAPPAGSTPPDAGVAAGASPASPSPVVVLTLDLPEGPQEFRLGEGEHTLGRSDDCEIRVDDRSLSRQHAKLVVRGDSVTVQDLGSSNHTFVEGQQLDSKVELQTGASIRFGLLEGRIVTPSAAP